MELDFESFAPSSSPQPKGNRNIIRIPAEDEPPKGVINPAVARISGWRKRVEKDLSDIAQDSIPKCPVTRDNPVLHREKLVKRLWPFNACVARPMSKKEMMSIPDAIKARDKEWTRLISKGTFDMENPKQYKDVAARARQRGKTVHFGVVFGFCVQKNAELTDQAAIYKYRYVF